MPSLQSRFIDELDADLIKNISHVSEHTNPFSNNVLDEYNSSNTHLLNKEELIKILLNLPEVKSEL